MEYSHKPTTDSTQQEDTAAYTNDTLSEAEQKIIQEANKIPTEDITEQLIINSKLIQDGKIALKTIHREILCNQLTNVLHTKCVFLI